MSYQNIPLQARVVQGNKVGENLLNGHIFTDVAGTKAAIERGLKLKFPCPIEIEWREVDLERPGQ